MMLLPPINYVPSNRLLDCFLFFQCLLMVIEAVVIDNGVEGQPTISCGSDMVSVWINTQKAFTGKVFVKGESEKNDCSAISQRPTDVITTSTNVDPEPGVNIGTKGPDLIATGTCPPCPKCPSGKAGNDKDTNGKESSTVVNSYYGRLVRNKRQSGVGSNLEDDSNKINGGRTLNGRPLSGIGFPSMAHLEIRMGTCNMRRQRQISPKGVAVEFTAVISFHRFFITKVDRAYRVRCFYMEADKSVSAEIGVSMPETTELRVAAEMPVCHYSVRRDSPDGPQVKYVQVGEKVFHRWECKSANKEMFGLLVHSCKVEDGKGQVVELLDKQGCSIDPVILNDLTYDSFMVAHVESHVFKFADRTALDFQCAIGICVTADAGCSGITPPDCKQDSQRKRRRQRSAATSNSSESIFIDSHPQHSSLLTSDFDISAPRLTVIDIDSGLESDELARLDKESAHESTLSFGRKFFNTASQSPSSSNEPFDLLRRSPQQFCLSVAGFGVFIATSSCIVTVGVMLAGTLYIMKRKGPLL